jgi:hypothetical protein
VAAPTAAAPVAGVELAASSPVSAAAEARRVGIAAISSALAAYPPGSSGYDVSQYQCGNIPTRPSGIAVVQVTGGALDNAPNPCYAQEARWAGPRLSTYVFMDGLPSPVHHNAMWGPGGNCGASNIACQSLNYGYNEVRRWVQYSRFVGVNPQMWWLDVEGTGDWSRGQLSNALVITGGLLGLQSEGLKGGVYASPAQWQEITGGMAIPGVPVWSPGAGNLSGPGYTATSFCSAPGAYSFGGGTLKLVQWGYQGPFPGSYSGPGSPYDQDYACPR